MRASLVARGRQVGSAVLAGSYNLSATVRMRVVQLGQGTRYQQIVALMQQAALDKPRLAVLAGCRAHVVGHGMDNMPRPGSNCGWAGWFCR
jgi:cation transport ATPase